MIQKVSFKNSKGLVLAGILHKPENPCKMGVVIAHGFTGHKDANFIPELASHLESKSFTVLRFDFSGNGESEGKFEEGTWTQFADDLNSAINFLRGIHNGPLAVIGFSMGGAVSIIAYSKYKNFDKLVLIAPAIKPATDKFLKIAWASIKEKGYVEFEDIKGRKWKLNRDYFEDRERYNLLELGKEIDIPVLIIIGDKDDTVSIDAAREFYQQRLEGRKFVVIKGENHVFHNRATSLIPHIDEFLK